MSRLYRPYVPIAVRVAVAERQAVAMRPCQAFHDVPEKPLRVRLEALLRKLFGDRPFELHHRPALVNRPRFRRGLDRKTYYQPPANDPDHLVYLPAADHDIETRVRGVGAQRSDLGQARYNKRVAKNRAQPKPKKGRKHQPGRVRSPVNKSTAKRKWPSRPLRGRRL